MNEDIIQIERAVLSAILQYNTGIELAASTGLGPQHFTEPKHRAVYKACCNLAVESTGIDLHTAAAELEQSGWLKKIGGYTFLSEFLAVISSSAHIKDHAAILIDNHLERQVLSITRGIERTGAGYQALAEVEKRLAAMKRDLPIGDSIEPFFTDASLDRCLDQMLKGPDDNDNFFPTGVAPLDHVIHGLERGTVISFNGLGGTGKTKLAIQILVRTARQGFPVGFLSLEMSKFRVMRWMLSHFCRIDSNFLQLPNLSKWDDVREDHLTRIKQRREELTALPVYVSDIAYPTVDQVEAIVSAWIRQGVGLVVMDYLERMVLGKDWKDECYPTARLADVAKQYNVAFVYLDHLNKEANRPGAGLSARHTRGSEMRKNNADLVIELRNMSHELKDRGGFDEPFSRIDAMIVKGREGATGVRIEDKIIADLSIGRFCGKDEQNDVKDTEV
jgi:replicative DNA helicase